MISVVLLGVITLAISFGAVLEAYEPGDQVPDSFVWLLLLDASLGLVAIGLYPLRHRAPMLIVASIVAIAAGSSLATGAVVFGVVSLATRRRPREILVVGAIFVVAGVVNDQVLPLADPLPLWQSLPGIAVIFSVLVLSGLNIGGRRALLIALHDQLVSARSEQAALLHNARTSERTRIAREMHDVLAHRLSLVALHSGALESRIDLGPEETSATAGVIRENAHRALVELREVLGVLRDDLTLPSALRPMPQPTLDSLDDLLEDNRVAGSPTELDLDETLADELHALDDSTSRHLYRIIQEGLTNARKHAPGQPVYVRLSGRPGHQIAVALSNQTNTYQTLVQQPGSGVGLVGLHERVRLAGGQMSAGPDSHNSFLMKVELPWKTN